MTRFPLLLAAALMLLATPTLAREVLHRPSEGEPDSLDPQKITAADAQAITRDMFIGLLTLGPEEHVRPGVAASYEVSPDGKTYTFHLRHDVKWSNGEPVTSADFLYSFRRLVDPKTAAADPSDLKQVANYDAIVSGKMSPDKLGVDAPDPYTLVLHLSEPRYALKFLLTDPMLFPLPRGAIEKWGQNWTQPGHMVSDGAYVMKSWTPEAEIVLEKNPLFFDAPSVKIDEVHWLNASDLHAALLRYRSGELDWVGLTRDDIGWAKANMKDQLHHGLVNSIGFIFFNMTKGVLAQDIRIRKALNLATDRVTIVTKIDPLGQVPAYGLTPSVISNYTQQNMPFVNTPMPQRISEAQQLMKEAGYGPDKPLHLTLSYPTAESTREILLGIKQMWQKIYVDLSLDNSEWRVFEQQINQRNFQLGIQGAMGPYDDYENGLDNYRSDAGQFNWCGYKNPKFDELFHAGSTALDQATRRRDMEAAERVVLADYPVIPIYYGARNTLVNPKLKGWIEKVIYPQSRYLSFKSSAS